MFFIQTVFDTDVDRMGCKERKSHVSDVKHLVKIQQRQTTGVLSAPFFCFLPYVNKLFGATNAFSLCFYKEVAKRG